jgi:hypothetical protein
MKAVLSALCYILLSLLVLANTHDRVFACTCIGHRTIQEELKQMDAVFVGTVLSKHVLTLIDTSARELFPSDTLMRNFRMERSITRYELSVETIYKGRITNNTVILYSAVGGGDCGVRLEAGRKYIIYGERKSPFGQSYDGFKIPEAKNTFWTYECLRTNTFSKEDAAELEKFTAKPKRKSQ